MAYHRLKWTSPLLLVPVLLAVAAGESTASGHEHSDRSQIGGTRDIRSAPARVAEVVVEHNGSAPAVAPAEPPRRVVHTDVEGSHNYMGTIAWSAFSGGVLGALLGTAVYYLDKGERATNIIYWAAGGVVLGAGVGVVQVMVQESRAETAVSQGPTDPAPTLRVGLYRTTF